jgi:hypothetical protein
MNGADHASEFMHGKVQSEIQTLRSVTDDHEKRIRFIERAFFIGSGVIFLIDKGSEILARFHQ